MEYILGIVLLMAVIGIFSTTLRIRSRAAREAALATPPFGGILVSSEARDSTPPSYDGERSVSRSPAQTPREQRGDALIGRLSEGVCLYCEKQALFPVPYLVRIRSQMLDWFYRRMNVVPVNKWTLELDADVHHPMALCGTHREIARGHLERRVAENQVDYAAFVERQHHEMYEFEAHGLDERMLDDAIAVKRGKKQKKMADVTMIQRQQLKAVNGTG